MDWQLALTVVFIGLLLLGARLDVKSRRLPNWLSAAVFALAIVGALLTAGSDFLSHFLHFAIALFAGILLFRVGVIGGGDAKFYSAAALWFPLNQGFIVLIAVSLAGVLLLFAMLGTRIARQRAEPVLRLGKVPYGVAIAVGASTIATINLLG